MLKAAALLSWINALRGDRDRPIDPRRTARGLTLLYGVALLLVGLLSTGAYLSFVSVIASQDSAAAAVNVSGRQRMLSQRIALETALLAHAAIDERPGYAAALRDAARVFLVSHAVLLSGDPLALKAASNAVTVRQMPPPDAAPDRLDPALAALFFAGAEPLDPLIRRYAEAARELAEGNTDAATAQAAQTFILTRGPHDMLPRLDSVVSAVQQAGEANVRAIRRVELIVWLLTLLLLMLEVTLIFRPLSRHVNWVIGRLDQERQAAVLAREAAEASDRAKTEFFSVVSHELRTPLNGILGLTELLVDRSGLNEEDRAYLRLIRGSGESLLRLIEQVLVYSQYASMTEAAAPVAFDLTALITDIAAEFRPVLAARDNALRVAMHPAFPPPMLGPAAELRLALRALVENAGKFTEAGRITLAPHYTAETGRLVIDVTDTGIGIPRDKVQDLFRPFRQADQSSTRRHGGLGLGLATARLALALSGGELGYTPQPQGGSRFTITLRCWPVGMAEVGGSRASAALALFAGGIQTGPA